MCYWPLVHYTIARQYTKSTQRNKSSPINHYIHFNTLSVTFHTEHYADFSEFLKLYL